METDQVVLTDLTPAEVAAICDFFHDGGVVGEEAELALRAGRRKLEAALASTVSQGDLVEGHLGSRAWVESRHVFTDGREGWWLRSVETGLGTPVTDEFAKKSLTVIDHADPPEASS